MPTPAKRRRVTAEMEGKYVITMPKGTTPRTKKILEQQAAKGSGPTASRYHHGGRFGAPKPQGMSPASSASRRSQAVINLVSMT